jgi:type III secretion system low calcium response chaperone LcrH/SycD
MTSQDDMIKQACESINGEITPEIQQALEGVMKNIFQRGMLPRDALGLSASAVENIYGHAYRLYNAGQYNEAQNLFRLLVMLDPGESKFLLGSAACFHMQKEYATASATYALVSVADPETPIPHYHAADCYLKMGLVGAAAIELKATIECCGEKPPYAMIRDRARMMLSRIESGQVEEGKVEEETEPTPREEDLLP